MRVTHSCLLLYRRKHIDAHLKQKFIQDDSLDLFLLVIPARNHNNVASDD